MEKNIPKNAEEQTKENVHTYEKLEGCISVSIVGIFFLLVIYLLIGIVKYPTSLGKMVFSFNNRNSFDLTYLELLINNKSILTWPFNDIDSVEIEKNIEEVFSKAAFIKKTAMNNESNSISTYSLYLKQINAESSDYPLTFPVISKILFKNTLSFSNDSLFLRKIVNRCKNDADVQFFCDNVIGSIQYLIVTYNSNGNDGKRRKWYGEILDYFSNKYVDFLSIIFMNYTGFVAEKNAENESSAQSTNNEKKGRILKETVGNVLEIVDSVKALKKATESIIGNSIQTYQNVIDIIKKNEDDDEGAESASADSASIMHEENIDEENYSSEIQDAQNLNLPEP